MADVDALLRDLRLDARFLIEQGFGEIPERMTKVGTTVGRLADLVEQQAAENARLTAETERLKAKVNTLVETLVGEGCTAYEIMREPLAGDVRHRMCDQCGETSAYVESDWLQERGDGWISFVCPSCKEKLLREKEAASG